MTSTIVIQQVFQEFWSVYNSEESLLPFFVPLTVWIGLYIYCYSHKISYHDSLWICNLHNLTALLLSSISLYYQNDVLLRERVCILFSLSYFVVDLGESIRQSDGPYTVHALFCLILGGFNYTTPLCQQLRTNSRATLTELSSPFLHAAKQTRNPLHFLLFVIVFSCCRILWIPIMMKQLPTAGMRFPTDVRQVLMLGFYSLNWFW